MIAGGFGGAAWAGLDSLRRCNYDSEYEERKEKPARVLSPEEEIVLEKQAMECQAKNKQLRAEYERDALRKHAIYEKITQTSDLVSKLEEEARKERIWTFFSPVRDTSRKFTQIRKHYESLIHFAEEYGFINLPLTLYKENIEGCIEDARENAKKARRRYAKAQLLDKVKKEKGYLPMLETAISLIRR